MRHQWTKRMLVSSAASGMILVVILGGAVAAGAAPKKPAAKHPAKPPARSTPSTPPAKPPAVQPAHEVKGTSQLRGDQGNFGETYTIGKDWPFNFTLKSAEFSLAGAKLGDQYYVPENNEKLLLVHYSVQNASPQDAHYSWESLRFTAIDAKDVNHEFINNVGRDGSGEGLDLNLKPAQKVDAFAIIKVPDAGVVPKLIVQSDGPVVRYDLRGKVRGLPAPYADPADATGSTAVAMVPAKPGAFYPLGDFDLRLDSASYADKFNGEDPEEGKRFLVITLTAKNRTSQKFHLTGENFVAAIHDSNGEKIEGNQVMLKLTRDEGFDGDVDPGAEAHGRIAFQLPKDLTAKTLDATEGQGRLFSFDLTGLPVK